jgi:epoxyqueuosine reductase
MNYFTPQKHSKDKTKGKISRYAWGKDYHLIIRDKLELIIAELTKIDSSFEAISYVDTGPVMDKVWAVRSGLGWQGKHTNVINKQIGSWFFIVNIITNWQFEYLNPIDDFCGSCTACIDACPTKAIVNEYVVDSNKCISYLTIENKKEIPEEFKDQFDNWLFGCDICQEVCPWNIRFSQSTNNAEFFPSKGNNEIDLLEVLNLTKEQFEKRFEISPVKRAKISGLKRNAKFLLNEF